MKEKLVAISHPNIVFSLPSQWNIFKFNCEYEWFIKFEHKPSNFGLEYWIKMDEKEGQEYLKYTIDPYFCYFIS